MILTTGRHLALSVLLLIYASGLAAAGVDAITTNRPAWLREQLQKKD